MPQHKPRHQLQAYLGVAVHVPYSMYYKPMDDLPYISSEQEGGLIIRAELIYELPYISIYMYKNFELKRGWAYNTYYTVRAKHIKLTNASRNRKRAGDDSDGPPDFKKGTDIADHCDTCFG